MWRIARALREPTDHERKHLGRVEPIFDPAWLRASYPRCIWDGRTKAGRTDFCSDACEEAYAHWESVQAEFDLRMRLAAETADEPEDDPGD